MLSPRDDPFPFEAVRDLLGVVRAMWAAAKASRAGRVDLARITRVGTELSRALDLAADARPGTLAYGAAWKKAEDATMRVADLVDGLTPAEPLVIAARERVSAAAARVPRKKRDER